MLILPLHKPLNRSNLPWATVLLVLVNVLVFVGWQAGDTERLASAYAYYAQSGLAEVEGDAYTHWLREHGRGAQAAALEDLAAPARAAAVAQTTQYDLPFQRALREGQLIEADQQAQWRQARAGYDQRMHRVFTDRHVLRHGEWSPRRMLSSAFLHAGVLHLLGNMVFLLAIGVLLEGAIGPALMLAVYVLGALGSSAASLLWRAGEVGAGLGASGAIAAMMGAFCVVWGRQPVRFFYWFVVMFDYVRAPAIWLLPAWLGWEVYNLFGSGDSHVAFDAHAGGLLCGALMGAALVAAGRRRDGFIRDDVEPTAAGPDDRWGRAQIHMGRMENDQAERLLEALAAEQPARFEVALARYRVARNAGDAVRAGRRAVDLLKLRALDEAQAAAQVHVLEQESLALPAEVRAGLAERWAALGQWQAAERLLEGASDLSAEDQAGLWLRVALAHDDLQGRARQQRLLSLLIERFPDVPQAHKARFLLDNA